MDDTPDYTRQSLHEPTDARQRAASPPQHLAQTVQEAQKQGTKGAAPAFRQANWTIAIVRFCGGLVLFGLVGLMVSAAGHLKRPEFMLPFLMLIPSLIFALAVPEKRTAPLAAGTGQPRSCLGWGALMIEHLFSGLLRLCGGGGLTVALTLILWNILMPQSTSIGHMPTSRDFVQFALEVGVVLCGGALGGLLTLVLPLKRKLWF